MIIGPALPALKETAKRAVALFFVDLAEGDGTPATLRAMYVLKAQQAEAYLATGSSLDSMIEREAEARGITPDEMATTIKRMAAESVDMEIARTRANVLIEGAEDAAGVMAVLAEYGVKINIAATELDPSKPILR